MSDIDKYKIKKIISENNIVDVIGRYIKIERYGINYKACCPFHKENHPSFYINESKQFFYCFGCSIGGDVIKFLQEYKKISFFEAIKILSPNENIIKDKDSGNNTKKLKIYSILQKASYFYHKELYVNVNKEIPIKYLKNRGMSGITAKKFLIGFAENNWNKVFKIFNAKNNQQDAIIESGLCKVGKKGIYDVFRNRIIFPIKDQFGKNIAFGARSIDDSVKPKYLNSPDNEFFKKSKNLYGIFEAKNSIKELNSVIVVEGYMDVVMLSQSGIQNVVSILGSNVSKDQIELLLLYTSNIYFCFDGDYAGQKAAIRTMELLIPIVKSNNNIRFIFLPFGTDPDTYISKNGKESFFALYKNAISLSNFIIHILLRKINIKSIDGRKKLISRSLYIAKKIAFDKVLKNLIKINISKLVGFDINIISNLYKQNKKTCKNNDNKINLEICLKAAVILLDNPFFVKKLEKRIILTLNDKKTYDIFYSKKLIGYNLLKIIINNLYSNNISINTIKMFLSKKKLRSFQELYEIIDGSAKSLLYKDFVNVFNEIKKIKSFFNLYLFLKKE